MRKNAERYNLSRYHHFFHVYFLLFITHMVEYTECSPTEIGLHSLFNALCRVFLKRSYVSTKILRAAHRRLSARHSDHMSFRLRKPLLQ